MSDAKLPEQAIHEWAPDALEAHAELVKHGMSLGQTLEQATRQADIVLAHARRKPSKGVA